MTFPDSIAFHKDNMGQHGESRIPARANSGQYRPPLASPNLPQGLLHRRRMPGAGHSGSQLDVRGLVPLPQVGPRQQSGSFSGFHRFGSTCPHVHVAYQLSAYGRASCGWRHSMYVPPFGRGNNRSAPDFVPGPAVSSLASQNCIVYRIPGTPTLTKRECNSGNHANAHFHTL